MKLRIACVQFSPVLGKVEANVAKVKKLLSEVKRDIDLLVLPELSLTGYNFPSPADIEPYLETSASGPTYKLASELSSKYGCTTVIGYPETFQNTTFNSALVVDEKGHIKHNYRKTHLYETDETWGCLENPDKTFPSFNLELGPEKKPVRANIGICMDLNPYKFEAPFNEFEFAILCWSQLAQLIIVPTAWLSSDSPSIKDGASKEEKMKLANEFELKLRTNKADLAEPLQLLVNYWILRLFPFLGHPMNALPRLSTKTTAVLCNRTGIEGEVLYGGSTSILQFDPKIEGDSNIDQQNPSVDVVGSLGWASEGVLYHEVDV